MAIYRSELLPLSETFIKGQAASLSRFEPVLVGLRPAARSLPLTQPTVILEDKASPLADIRRKLFTLAGFAPGFYKRVRAFRPALIHAHFATDGVAALPLAEKLGLPLVVTLHGYDVTGSDEFFASSIQGKLFLKRRQALWAKTAAFVCVSEFIRQRAVESGFPAAKLHVRYIGIDLDEFSFAAGKRREKLVVFVGRLVEKKGCEFLIRAMDIVQKSAPDARLQVIGDGPLGGSLRSLAASLSIRGEFSGAQPSTEIRKALERASVFCTPSVTAKSGDSEGLGMVFLEAQAMGVPVASFRHGGIPEAVEHGQTGLLADEGDIEGLAKNILRFLEDPVYREECSVRARARALEQFDIRERTILLEELYDEVLSSGRSPATQSI